MSNQKWWFRNSSLRLWGMAVLILATVSVGAMWGTQAEIKSVYADWFGEPLVLSVIPAPAAGAGGKALDAWKNTVSSFNATCGKGCLNTAKVGIAKDGRDVLARVQKLVNQLHAKGGGTLYFPKGKYGFRGSLELHSNVHIIGAGAGTEWIQLKSNVPLIIADSVSNVILSSLILNQTQVKHTNGQSNHGIRINDSFRIGLVDVQIKGPLWNGGERGDGLYIKESSAGRTHEIVVLNVSVEQASRNGIAIVGGSDLYFSQIRISALSGQTNAAFDIEPSRGETVRRLTVDGMRVEADDLQVYSLYGLAEDIVLRDVAITRGEFILSGNTNKVLVDRGNSLGLTTHGDDDDVRGSRDIYVRGTKFENTTASQLAFLDGESITFDACIFFGGTKAAIRDVGTTDRITVKNSTVSGSTGDGIYVYIAPIVELVNNQVYENARHGIVIGNRKSTTDKVIVSGRNVIQDNGGDGIQLNVPQGLIDFSGALIQRNGDSGFELSSCQGARVVDNEIYNNERGLLLADYDKYRVIRSVDITGNVITNRPESANIIEQQYGIRLINGPGTMENINITDNEVSDNLVKDIQVEPSGSVANLVILRNEHEGRRGPNE